MPDPKVWFQNRRAKWRRQEKLENQNALRNLNAGHDYPSPNGLGVSISRTSNSPLSSSTQLSANISNSALCSSAAAQFYQGHHLTIDWLTAATGSQASAAALLNAASLPNSLPGFMSHSSSVYPSYITSPGSGISPLIPHQNLSGASERLLSAGSLIGINRAAKANSPAGSPLNLSVNGSGTDKGASILAHSGIMKKNEDIFCGKESGSSLLDSRTSSIAALRLKAKEHVELIHKGLAIV